MPGENSSVKKSASLLSDLLNDLPSSPQKISRQRAEEIVQTVEDLIKSSSLQNLDPVLARAYLTRTSASSFLRKLGYPGRCRAWADTCFSLIQHFNYGLLELFEDRVQENPEHVLFVDLSEGRSDRWTCAEIASYLRLLAGSFYLMSDPDEPRVAILAKTIWIPPAATWPACSMTSWFPRLTQISAWKTLS